MATQVKRRRGTAPEIADFTPALAEWVHNESDNTIHAGDGITPGGIKHINEKTLPGYAKLAFDTVQDMQAGTLKGGRPHAFSLGEYLTTGGTTWVVAPSGRIDLGSGLFAKEVGPVHLRDFDSPFDGTNSDDDAVKLAISGGNVVLYIGEGLYYCEVHWRIYENTHVIAHPNALIYAGAGEGRVWVNGEVGNSTYASGYDGDGNLRFEGGIYEGENPNAGAQTSFFKLGHASNIKILNVVMRNSWRGHPIELNAIENAVVTKCTFENQSVQGSDSSRDTINIDFADAGGFPEFGSYDGTPCKDVWIHNNHFKKVFRPVANHATEKGAGNHDNINIYQNTFENITDSAVVMNYFDNSTCSDNMFRDIGRKAVNCSQSNNIVVSDNKIFGVSQEADNTFDALQFDNGDVCLFRNNRVDNTGFPNNYQDTYRIFTCSDVTVETGNDVLGSGEDFNATGQLLKINGYYRFSINRDEVAFIPLDKFRRGNQGSVEIQTFSAADTVLDGIYKFRCGGTSNYTEVIASRVGSLAEITTGPLTGTTGTDEVMTFSANDDGLYIENRTSSKKVYVRID